MNLLLMDQTKTNLSSIEVFNSFNLIMPPRPMVIKAIELFNEKTGIAIDFGAGEGVDCAYLLAHNWQVIAVDINTSGVENMLKNTSNKYVDKITVVKKRFHNVIIPTVDLFVANYSLPFCDLKQFPYVWERIKAAIKPGGRFAGTFFGKHDDFKHRAILLDSEQIKVMFEGFEYDYYNEGEQEGEVINQKGNITLRHWHTFDIIAKKKNS